VAGWNFVAFLWVCRFREDGGWKAEGDT